MKPSDSAKTLILARLRIKVPYYPIHLSFACANQQDECHLNKIPYTMHKDRGISHFGALDIGDFRGEK